MYPAEKMLIVREGFGKEDPGSNLSYRTHSMLTPRGDRFEKERSAHS